MTDLNPFLVLLVSALLVTFAWFRLLCLMTALRTMKWVRAPGEIISAEWIQTPLATRGRGYMPSVRYRYRVGGVVHIGGTVSYGGMHDTYLAGDDGDLDAYPPGACVDVWYDPANPSRAVLIRGATAATWVLAVVSGCLAVAWIGLCIVPIMRDVCC